MRNFFIFLLFGLNLIAGEGMRIYDIEVKDIEGKRVKLQKYESKVMLIVNVASRCGYTNQYEGLQRLHEKYAKDGLSILAFPCNQFLSQEPGTEEEIKNFCTMNFGVTFDIFSKIDVNGENTHPLYRYLKESAGGFMVDTIKWNFTKFLVDRDGKVIKRYAPSTKPQEIEGDIEKLL